MTGSAANLRRLRHEHPRTVAWHRRQPGPAPIAPPPAPRFRIASLLPSSVAPGTMTFEKRRAAPDQKSGPPMASPRDDLRKLNGYVTRP